MGNSEKDGQYRKELGRILKGSRPGDLKTVNGPFVRMDQELNNPKQTGKTEGSVAADLELNLPRERLENRRGLLDSIDSMRRDLDGNENILAADEYEQRALDLILGSAADTFDLSQEPPRLLESYDTSAMKVGHKVFRESTLGHQMLLARRMVEAGSGFVTVHSAGWDMHADNNNPGMVKGMNMLGWTVDKAVSAFLADLEARGLSEKVLLVLTGDFGRTPTINKKGGRDHWAKLGTLAFAGGGLPMGQVIGRADRRNAEPSDNPINPSMMMGTILRTLFDFGQLRVAQGIPQEIIRHVENAHPIPELSS